ncbi:Acyl-CoA N-acyltransferase [Penicillium waksmanii]|uniref:Acyl-CoA N-acyltransferase n=1 Tax=Penicillium waksmanii TaxID=69791 RepID=UPI0025495C98|nr:Acyl-CoA N-acyltransferase [Penicillium waksmanii]KAJ5965258.1 Acyl-CoA N-acyltransferase [Penicillium waksmanii]
MWAAGLPPDPPPERVPPPVPIITLKPPSLFNHLPHYPGISSFKMRDQQIRIICGSQVTDEELGEAAVLFRDNYGVWGEQTGRAGQPVSLSVKRMRSQYLPSSANTIYARVTVDGTFAGYAFACRWQHQQLNVCWITQLVINRNFRNLGLAKALLNALRERTDHVYGIMSSHPAACLAAASSFGGAIERISLEFIAQNAENVLSNSPIQYIRDAQLHGSLFGTGSDGMVSGVDTGFFVDHTEPNSALQAIQTNLNWPLGNLVEGHEYLLLIRRYRRSDRLNSAAA